MSPDVAIQAPSISHPMVVTTRMRIQNIFQKNQTLLSTLLTLFLLLSPSSLHPRATRNDPMDTLPTELHAYICQMGCIDQGTSARNLSKVSRYYNQVAKPYLFRNVSAAGIPQCLALLEQLEATPEHMRQIAHLFLSDTPCAPSSLSSSPTSTSTSTSTSNTRLEDIDIRTLIRLITLSAPSLKTLTFVSTAPFSSTALIARIFRTSFPLLQKLTISGYYPFPSSSSSSPSRFPSLTALHLDGNRNPHGLLQVCALGEVFPGLKSLKITGLGAAGAFVGELEEALAAGGDSVGRWDEDEDECADFVGGGRLPVMLRDVVVQAGPGPIPGPVVAGMKDNAAVKDEVLVRRLESLKTNGSANASAHGVKLVVMERKRENFSVEELRAVWLEGIRVEY